MNRFEKQVKLEGFGEIAQYKLKDARALLIGAGGLGCPVLLYLAAAGVGTIGIADGDTVTLSNLNRQILYGEADINNIKAVVAADYIKSKYSDINIVVIAEYITTANAIQYISQYDIIIDCTDNFTARYIINDACVLLDKSLVFGAIYQYEGHMAVFNVKNKNDEKLNYRDLFPVMPGINDVPDCNTVGVIGVLPGIIGVLMASESIKLLSGYTTPYADNVLWYNMKHNTFYETAVIHNPVAETTTPASIDEFEKNNYSTTCPKDKQVNWNIALNGHLYTSEEVLFIDVRNSDEWPKVNWINHINIPLNNIETLLDKTDLPNILFFFCQSGIRSRKAIEIIKGSLPEKQLFSIIGGVNAYTTTNLNHA